MAFDPSDGPGASGACITRSRQPIANLYFTADILIGSRPPSAVLLQQVVLLVIHALAPGTGLQIALTGGSALLWFNGYGPVSPPPQISVLLKDVPQTKRGVRRS